MHLPLRCLLTFAWICSARSAEGLYPSYPPTEPADAAKTIRVKNGFTMDLIAAEPLITSPVAVAYDENGVAYVAEMRDYPYTNKNTHLAFKENTSDAPIGRVTQLIDRDGDGIYDESHIFADGLSWPTGIVCWKGGIFVTATPDVWYFKDTDNDHHADVRQKVFTGFRKFNIQAVMNTPQWGLDNRITFAGGTNGGQVTLLSHPEAPTLKVVRNDLRFDPRTLILEAIAGGARFGHGVDDWGNRFLCTIRNPAQHVVFDGTLTARNPFLAIPNPVHDVREPGDSLPVMRISPLEPWRDLRAQRWVKENYKVPRSELVAGGVFTSAAGITLYRGAAYPNEYHGQAFVAEVANNLVQRQTVVKDGVTFKVEPADSDAEFIASTDIWFRPVNFANAPDGTLHVVDMYRETIEHPWSIPDDMRARLDLEKGRDRGRLYRLTPPGFKVPKPPHLGTASTGELVKTLENPNGWWRETAQRLLFERQDPAAIDPLRVLLEQNPHELARLHAIWTLQGLDALRDDDLLRALRDSSAGVREHAVRLAANRISNRGNGLQDRVLSLARDPEIRVRYQVAFAAGGVANEAAITTQLEIIAQNMADPWVRAAALSGPPEQAEQIVRRALADEKLIRQEGASDFLRQAMFVAGAHHHDKTLADLIGARTKAHLPTSLEHSFWRGLGEGLTQAGLTLRTAFSEQNTLDVAIVEQQFVEARLIAGSPTSTLPTREHAVWLLGHDSFSQAAPILAPLLIESGSPTLQTAAIKALAGFKEAGVAPALLKGWHGYTPSIRDSVLATLLARPERMIALLNALESHQLSIADVNTVRRAQLLSSHDAVVKKRAERLFSSTASGTRAEVFERNRGTLQLHGDSTRGEKVFDTVCAACHRQAGRGIEIGPNLETVRGWDREKLLLNIIDPNREVAPNFVAYTVELKDGSSLTGMITEESSTGIKLKRVGSGEETILRQNIEKMTSSSASLMPEGLETAISPDQMADLLAFLGAQ